jgi:hypothetical protein
MMNPIPRMKPTTSGRAFACLFSHEKVIGFAAEKRGHYIQKGELNMDLTTVVLKLMNMMKRDKIKLTIVLLIHSIYTVWAYIHKHYKTV